jgi:hypothetical protein
LNHLACEPIKFEPVAAFPVDGFGDPQQCEPRKELRPAANRTPAAGRLPEEQPGRA